MIPTTEIIPIILIVDDDDINRRLLGRMIDKMGYESYLADSGKEALEIIERVHPHLILSDVTMPEMDGYTLCRLLKENPLTKEIPFIFVSGLDAKEEKIKGLSLGAVDFVTKPYEREEVQIRVKCHLDIYLMKQKMEEYNYKLNQMIQEQMQTIENVKKMALVALAKVTEGTRQIATENHLENVSYNSRLLAQAMALTPKYEHRISQKFIDLIQTASMIHDIGKIAIPESILLKPGTLTEKEKKIMERHCEKGIKIFEEVFHDMETDEYMKVARNIVLYHHEQWDGGGYPCGLKEEEIPLEARIVSVVDCYDTLRSERVYKKAYTWEEAKEKMETVFSGYFEPDIIEIFWKVERQMKKGM